MVPAKMLITSGTTADCTQACQLIDEINAENLLADNGTPIAYMKRGNNRIFKMVRIGFKGNIISFSSVA
jgi:hypothetical protein